MGRLEQRLGRDASHVKARASEMSALPLLDEGYLHPQLAGPDRRYVSTVTATDHYEVELLSHPGLLSVLGFGLQVSGCSDAAPQPLPDLMPLHCNSNCPSPPEPSSLWHAGQKCDGLPLTFSRTTSPPHPGQGCPCFSKTRK